MTIEMRPLGRTGTDVTILGYGAMELRGQPHGPPTADEDAGQLLNEVLDAGINLIDTSPDYGGSEELIGRYVGHRRDEYFLASKCGCLLGRRRPGPDLRSRTTGVRPTSGPTSSRACAGSVPTGWTWSRCTCHRAGTSWKPTTRCRPC